MALTKWLIDLESAYEINFKKAQAHRLINVTKTKDALLDIMRDDHRSGSSGMQDCTGLYFDCESYPYAI